MMPWERMPFRTEGHSYSDGMMSASVVTTVTQPAPWKTLKSLQRMRHRFLIVGAVLLIAPFATHRGRQIHLTLRSWLWLPERVTQSCIHK